MARTKPIVVNPKNADEGQQGADEPKAVYSEAVEVVIPKDFSGIFPNSRDGVIPLDHKQRAARNQGYGQN